MTIYYKYIIYRYTSRLDTFVSNNGYALAANLAALAISLCATGCAPDFHGGDAPNSDARDWWPAPPAIHFTPAGMRRLPPHDIAGVLYDEKAGVWWLWVYGCELADGPAGWPDRIPLRKWQAGLGIN